MLRVRVAANGAPIAERLRLANTHWTRMKGLLGTRSLESGEGLWIKPCRQVHMFGMRYPIDVVFLDADHCVVGTAAGLAPWKVSPKVGRAVSVLELPVGTIAKAALVDGVQLVIEGDADDQSRTWIDAVGTWVGNFTLCVLYASFAYAHLKIGLGSGAWAPTIPIVALESLLAGLFLVRRRTRASSERPFDWAVGIVGTFLPFFLRPSAEPGALTWLGSPVQVVGFALAVASLLSLGRSIGLVAANRGIKTLGLYAVVRHPMYTAYLLTYAGYLACHPTPRNVLIVALTFVALVVRALVEERFLARDATYQTYMNQVRWRFVPWVC